MHTAPETAKEPSYWTGWLAPQARLIPGDRSVWEVGRSATGASSWRPLRGHRTTPSAGESRAEER